jgi:hypothetical protein
MRAIQEPIELAAAPEHAKINPRVESGQDLANGRYRESIQVASLDARDGWLRDA